MRRGIRASCCKGEPAPISFDQVIDVMLFHKQNRVMKKIKLDVIAGTTNFVKIAALYSALSETLISKIVCLG